MGDYGETHTGIVALVTTGPTKDSEASAADKINSAFTDVKETLEKFPSKKETIAAGDNPIVLASGGSVTNTDLNNVTIGASVLTRVRYRIPVGNGRNITKVEWVFNRNGGSMTLRMIKVPAGGGALEETLVATVINGSGIQTQGDSTVRAVGEDEVFYAEFESATASARLYQVNFEAS